MMDGATAIGRRHSANEWVQNGWRGAEMANVHKATCGPAWQNCPTRLAKGERTLDIRLAAQREMLRLCFAGESSHGRRRRRLPGAAQFRRGFIRAVRRGLSATHGRGIWAC